MKRTRKIVYVLEAIVVFALMAVLTSIAVPKIGDMIEQDRNDMRSEELHDVETAVAEMLSESTVKTLQSTDFIQDISLVQTNDSPPLFLGDYLDIEETQSSDLGCSYSFAADGEVTQECP
jgi:type II secretory pathway pseudopilin PulG